MSTRRPPYPSPPQGFPSASGDEPTKPLPEQLDAPPLAAAVPPGSRPKTKPAHVQPSSSDGEPPPSRKRRSSTSTDSHLSAARRADPSQSPKSIGVMRAQPRRTSTDSTPSVGTMKRRGTGRHPTMSTGSPKAVSAPPAPSNTSIPSQVSEQKRQIEYLAAKLSKTRKQLKTLYAYVKQELSVAETDDSSDAQLDELDDRIGSLEEMIQTLSQRVASAKPETTQAVQEEELPDEADTLDDHPLIVPGRDALDGETENRIDRFLRLMVERGASDLHLTVGRAPMFRDSGDMEPLRYRRLNHDDWRRLVKPITPKRTWHSFTTDGDADFAYEIPEVGRFRVNLFRQSRGGGGVFRVIPQKIMTVEQLGLPEQIHRVAKILGGLILVTGPTGSGKSTTLAAIINEINEQRSYHIITLEDPIEFVHANKRSVLHQREIGTHSANFSKGLSDAVREDPNLLLVGEMRDLETIRLALESAEKGLLVFGTVHTNNAAKTVDRIINSFAISEQETIRTILADTIRSIVAQQLVKRLEGGRVAAIEILFGSPALSNLIREGKTHQITSLIQTGQRQGMIAMDDSLRKLVDEGLISLDSAFEKAIDKASFVDASQLEIEEKALKTAAVTTEGGQSGSGSSTIPPSGKAT